MTTEMITFIEDYGELDAAIQTFFSGIFVDDGQGGMKEAKVMYYAPDIDFENLEYPSIIFYRTEPFLDTSRWKVDEIRDNFVYDANDPTVLLQMDIRKPPEPWSVLYSVRTYYEYNEDGVALNKQIRRKLPRETIIRIKGQNYNIWNMPQKLTGSQYKDFGRTEEGTRDFSEQYTFRLDFYLDLYDRTTVQTVKQVGVNVNQNT